MQGIAVHLQSFTKRSLYMFGAVLVVSILSTIFASQATHAATRTWTGTAGDYQIGTSGNWSGGVAPTTGDILNFTSFVGTPNGEANNQIELTNNISNTVFGGVISADVSGSLNYYKFDTLRISSGSTVEAGTNLGLAFTHLIGTGTITLDGPVVHDLVADQAITKGDSTVYKAQATQLTVESGTSLMGSIEPDGSYAYAGVGLMNIQNGASVTLCGGSGFASVATNFVLGGGSGANPIINLSACFGGNGTVPTSAGAEFTGSITLQSDAKIATLNQTLIIKGSLVSNGHELLVETGDKSRLKGNGTVGTVSLKMGGTIAPGLSPGVLNTGNLTMVEGSIYDFELGGLVAGTEYDQIKVTGTVSLGSGTLNPILYNGFVPTVGQSYVIIDNDGSDAVTGTFAGLPEGATVTVDGHYFKVSYVGGDGNDVSLTVVSIPSVPNTGAFHIDSKNPIVVIALGIVSAVSLVIVATRLKAKSNR